MRFSARYLCMVLLTVLSLPTLVAAQTTTQQTARAPRSSVSGRVTIKEKGVGGVLVGLRKTDFQFPTESYQKATTDADGSYRITNIPPGNYEVVSSVPAFVAARGTARSKQVIVGDDDNIEGINFALVRGGVITGRITDADGRPLIQQQVGIYFENAFTPRPQQQPNRQVFPAMSVQTDDRGIYRVFGLQAGSYKVASGRNDDVVMTGPSPLGRASYKLVFYPDADEPDKAKVIEVSEGSEATEVDIVLGRALQTFAATGRVIDGERGLPLPNIRFSVHRMIGQRPEYVNTPIASNVQGEFIIEGLLPGRYAINLLPNQIPGNEMRAEALNFEIIDQDISGVVVKLLKGASVSGVVVIESEDKAVQAKLYELQLRGFVAVPGGGVVGTSVASPIGPDGSFRLVGLASGTLNLNIGMLNRPMPPKGFSIARMEHNGVATRGIEIKDGENVTGVRVIVAYGNAVIRGVVTTENGPLPEGTRVTVNLTKPGERNGPLIRPPIVDARGRFLIEGIPAGTYELTTVIGITTQRVPARVLKRVVTVQEGSTQDLTIAVDLADPPAKP